MANGTRNPPTLPRAHRGGMILGFVGFRQLREAAAIRPCARGADGFRRLMLRSASISPATSLGRDNQLATEFVPCFRPW